MDTMEKQAIIKNDYAPSAYRLGVVTNIIGLILCFLPVIMMGVVHDTWPQAGPVFQGFLVMSSIVGITWVLLPVQYFPIMGIAGTYMSNLSGNLNNIRMPCCVAAESAVDVDPGDPEVEIFANMAIAVSVFVNLAVLTFGLIAGTAILSALPPAVNGSLNYLLPALRGACIIMSGWKDKRVAFVALICAAVVRILVMIGLPISSYADMFTIVSAIVISIILQKKKVFVK